MVLVIIDVYMFVSVRRNECCYREILLGIVAIVVIIIYLMAVFTLINNPVFSAIMVSGGILAGGAYILAK